MHAYLRHLANFARIVEAGSMKAASDILDTAPSGLSDSVRILESRLGTALLIRHKGGVTPTSEGERVYAAASGIVDLLNDAMGAEEGAEITGTCRLSVPTEVAQARIGTALSYLRAAYPKLDLKVFAEDEVLDHSRFGRDYFLRIARKLPAYDGLRPIWTGRAKAILVASAALVPAEKVDDAAFIAQQTAIVGVARKAPVQFPLQAPKGTLAFRQAIGVSHPASQLMLAIQGHGVTGCLDFCASDPIRQGTLRQVLAARFSVPLEVHLLTPHRRKRTLDAAITRAMALMIDGEGVTAPD